MPSNSTHFYDFGAFRLDEAERLLWRGDEVVPLTPKAFDMLLVLVEGHGHVLTKEELMKRVWPDAIVEEANLSHNIYRLREVLGEGRNGENFIETLPRRGYRFVARVTEIDAESFDLAIQEHSKVQIVIEEDDEGGAGIRAIAVLPFKPLVADDRDESLEMGMADTLIMLLGNLHQIIVRPVSAVRKYADLHQDAVAAGRELSVESVLDGSIQKQGDRIRVTVRLLNVPDGWQLWADKFDEKFTDIFGLQDTIAAKVVDALALKLSGSERELLASHYTDNTEAYQLYLKGRFYWLGSKTEERMMKTIQYFNRAIKVDPNYALAYSGLADGYVVLGTFYVMAPKDAFAKAKVAATKALELDDTLAEAHTSISVIKLYYEFDWSGYEREYRRVIELNPNYATAHYEYAQYLAAMGRFEEATREGKRAQELDPLSVTMAEHSAWMSYFARDYDGAIEAQRKVIEFDPGNFAPHRRLGLAYLQKNMNAEALAEIQQSHDLSGGNAEELAYLGYVYAVTGKRAEAHKVLDELQEQSKRRYVSPYLTALIYTGLGNKDQAFIWLERAYEDRSANIIFLKVEPILDPLRSDPRYGDLMRRMNLTT
jgi:DNA-binding winged helix-turn-helix (wHTH) protein/tetratricopeptide (TPR) repeat protein